MADYAWRQSGVYQPLDCGQNNREAIVNKKIE